MAKKNGNGRAEISAAVRQTIRCAVYTRKSTDEGLQQEFNSLDAQREAGEAFILSQRHEGWQLVPTHYDDGGYSGGNMERPALKRLLVDIEARKVDCVLVYKVDRLSRSLMDFARIMESFDKRGVSFVSVTQAVQHHDFTGAPHAEHPPLLRSVRKGDHFRTYPRQAVGRTKKGQVDRRPPGAWIRYTTGRAAV